MISLKIKLLISALIVMMGVVGFFYIKSLRADKARLTAELAAVGGQVAGLQAELEANRQALKDREETISNLQAETEKLEGELNDLYANDEAAGSWANSIIPDSIFNRLR